MEQRYQNKGGKMKIKTITNLLLTASSLFIIGCSNTDDDSSSSSKKRTEVSKDSQMPLYLSHANNIHNNGEAVDALSASNITDASYIKNSLANRSRLASSTQAAALRLSDTTGHKELPKATEDKPVLFDMLGSTDPKHPRTLNHINREGRISGLYMEHVKVSMESGGRMDTLVAHAKNTEIATNTSAPFTAHAFYLDERASVTGNDQIHFADTPDTRFGTTLEGLKKAHPKRYDQQTKGGISLEGGEFVIKGIMVKQTIPKGMTLRAFGTETRINNLTHSGGSLVVKGSSKLHVTNYEVTENSPFEFFWDTNFREPRFVIEGQLKMSGNRNSLSRRCICDSDGRNSKYY